MPLLEKHTSPLLGIWKIDESESDLLNLLNRHDDYRHFLTLCKAEVRKKEWLATRVLLKAILGEELIISHHKDGAPFLPDRPDIAISISHTKGYVAVYCKPTLPIGIDIEYRAERIQKIKHKFLTEAELTEIDSTHETEHLLICWCAKETLFKLIRQDEVDFRTHLHIKPFPYASEGEIAVYETKTSKQESFVLSYRVTPDFVLTFSR